MEGAAGLPLSKSRGKPSNGEIEAKLNRIRVKMYVSRPEQIGLEECLRSKVKEF